VRACLPSIPPPGKPPVAKLNGGDGLIDRAAGGDLHNKKVNRDDGPQGGDDQQQTADQVGAHMIP
jgi:hypothetical protein